MQFEMKQSNYIVCPKCNNDKSFECFGDRVDYGIFSIRIRCRKCDWVSDELYEETGYYPDLSKHAIQCHVQYLHEMQQESKEKYPNIMQKYRFEPMTQDSVTISKEV